MINILRSINSKKYFLLCFLLIVAFSYIIYPNDVSATSNFVVYSTSDGGYWYDPNTWEEKIKPSEASKVIIRGPVEVDTLPKISNLQIEKTGSIKGNGSLSVYGDILNNGSILNGTIKAQGNITNNGIWNNKDQTILLKGGPRYIDGLNPIQNAVETKDDILITNSPVFAGKLLALTKNFTVQDGQTLTLLNDFHTYGKIKAKKVIFGGDNQILRSNESFNGIMADEIRMEGSGSKTIDSPLSFYGNLFIEPGVVIDGDRTLYVYGSIFNKGKINNSCLNVSNNIENNGVWENYFCTNIMNEKDADAIGYEFKITDTDGKWGGIIYSTEPLFNIKNLVNEKHFWQVKPKYKNYEQNEWSDVFSINAGNLFDEDKKVSVYNKSDTKTDSGIFFPDVPLNAFYKSELIRLAEQKIINGYPDGTFKPNQTINRSELLKIAMTAGNFEIVTTKIKKYTDIDDKEWFNPYVQTATKNGIIKGYDDGSFKPANLINRAEAIKIIIISLVSAENINCIQGSNYNDVNKNDWFYSYVCQAEQLGILDRINNNFEPGKQITRAEVVYWVGKLLNK